MTKAKRFMILRDKIICRIASKNSNHMEQGRPGFFMERMHHVPTIRMVEVLSCPGPHPDSGTPCCPTGT